MEKIAIIGCGYVADYYVLSLNRNSSNLQIAGVFDIDALRAIKFSQNVSVPVYDTFEDVLEDKSVSIIVNLTNPHSHFTVSKQALEAGKNVYTEKPIAMNYEEAKELVQIAEGKGLIITSAPCSCLSEPAQILFKAIRDNEVGKIRLVYAELDDGAIHNMDYRSWRNPSGTPWPYVDEFQVGSTFEHAGYLLTWLTTFFGPAKKVVAFSNVMINNKCDELEANECGTDFSIAVITFDKNVVARFTCGIVAPFNHSLQIIGDEGVLSVNECWDYNAPVYIQRKIKPCSINKHASHCYLEPKSIYSPIYDPTFKKSYNDTHNMDFSRGITELSNAINQSDSLRLSPRQMLHVTELVWAINRAKNDNFVYIPKTDFHPPEPMPWAEKVLEECKWQLH